MFLPLEVGTLLGLGLFNEGHDGLSLDGLIAAATALGKVTETTALELRDASNLELSLQRTSVHGGPPA